MASWDAGIDYVIEVNTCKEVCSDGALGSLPGTAPDCGAQWPAWSKEVRAVREATIEGQGQPTATPERASPKGAIRMP